MASPHSRIPVSAHHSRIPVLGPALAAASSSSRITTSSSMPSVTIAAVSDPTTVASTSTGNGTLRLENSATSDMWNGPDEEDQAWGKIERLRTRRVFSEGSSHVGESPTFVSGFPTTDYSPSLDYRPFDPPARKAEDGVFSNATASARREHNQPPPARPRRPSGPRSRPLSGRSERLQSPKRDQTDASIDGSISPEYQHDPLPPDPSSVTTLPSRDRRRSPGENVLLGDTIASSTAHGDSNAQPSSREPTVRPKLVSTVSAHGTGMLALGFREVDRRANTSVTHTSIDPLDSAAKAGPSRRHGMDGTVGPVSPKRADRGLPPVGFETYMQPRRKAVDIRQVSSSSFDKDGPRRTDIPSRTAAFVQAIARNPPENPIMLDTAPTDSDNRLGKILSREHIATTAEKRHQPQLRLSSMPNVPTLRASGITHPFRSPGSGESPPIPPKNPLRQRSSVGAATPTSQGSTPTVSGFPTPNGAYVTPSETPGIGILDRAPGQSSLPPIQTFSPISMPLEPGRKEIVGHRPERLNLTTTKRADISQPPYRSPEHGKSPNTANTVTVQEVTRRADTTQLRSTSASVSVSLSVQQWRCRSLIALAFVPLISVFCLDSTRHHPSVFPIHP